MVGSVGLQDHHVLGGDHRIGAEVLAGLAGAVGDDEVRVRAQRAVARELER